MPAIDSSFLDQIVRAISQQTDDSAGEGENTLLSHSAESYAAKLNDDDKTPVTGFNPRGAELFEAAVEAAYLVANADGEFDEEERNTFASVVMLACGLTGIERTIHGLVDELGKSLLRDGLRTRTAEVCRRVELPSEGKEVLRIAAILAQVSGGVDDSERGVLDDLASGFGLEDGATEEAVELAIKLLPAVKELPTN